MDRELRLKSMTAAHVRKLNEEELRLEVIHRLVVLVDDPGIGKTTLSSG
jgi:hypothetical protein